MNALASISISAPRCRAMLLVQCVCYSFGTSLITRASQRCSRNCVTHMQINQSLSATSAAACRWLQWTVTLLAWCYMSLAPHESAVVDDCADAQ